MNNLDICNLSVSVDNLPIINDLNLTVQPGSVHAIMGPNGSGKSSLAYTIMGHPRYTITAGTIIVNGHELHNLSPDKRAQLGIFLAFQHPFEIPGVSVFTFLKEAVHAVSGQQISVSDFQEQLEEALRLVGLDSTFAQRNLNDGFSGGEKKRLEIAQLLLLKPRVAILDEIDSGLDIDALKLVTLALAKARELNPRMSIILITHYNRLLDYMVPDFVHILGHGTIIKSGNASLAQLLEQKGYDAI